MASDIRRLMEDGGFAYAEAVERFGGNEPLYRRLACKYLADENFDALQAALERSDLAGASRAAHSLKGLAGNLSLRALHACARRVNDALRDGDAARARSFMPAVREAHERARRALAELEAADS